MRSAGSVLKPGSENAEVMEAPREGLAARFRKFFGVEAGRVTYGVISEREYPEYEGRSLQIRIGKQIIEVSLLKEREADKKSMGGWDR